MKNLFYYLIGVLLVAFVVVSCKTKEQKENPGNTIHTSELTNEDQRKINIEYNEFKLQINEEIKENERKIDKLISDILKDGKTLDDERGRRILLLKKENDDLKDRLNNYNLNTSDWDKFKTDFNSDMKDIGTTFSDLFSED